jgi:putative transposase
MVFHVLNRGVGRMRLFLQGRGLPANHREDAGNLSDADLRLLPDVQSHWHLVLWPERDGDLGAFLQKLTITHERNWHPPPLEQPSALVYAFG